MGKGRGIFVNFGVESLRSRDMGDGGAKNCPQRTGRKKCHSDKPYLTGVSVAG